MLWFCLEYDFFRVVYLSVNLCLFSPNCGWLLLEGLQIRKGNSSAFSAFSVLTQKKRFWQEERRRSRVLPWLMCVCSAAWSCLTLCDPMDFQRDFPGKNTGMGCHSLQGFFPAQLLTLISCIGRKILYHWVTWEAPAINLGSRYWCHLVRII